MRQVLIAISLLATWASVALVAQMRYLPDAPGTWKPWRFIAYGDNRRLLGARPADVKELEAQLLRLNAILKKTDGFTNPIGFSVETVGLARPGGRPAIGRAPGSRPHLRPLPASLNFGAYAVHEYGTGATAKRDDTGETAQLLFFVNQLAQPLFSTADHRVAEFEKLDADVARLAAPQPDVLGFPRYGDTLVLKKSAEPIWAAVTFADALDLVARSIDSAAGGRARRGRTRPGGLRRYDGSEEDRAAHRAVQDHRAAAEGSGLHGQDDKGGSREGKAGRHCCCRKSPAAKAVVTKSEQELAGARTMAAGLSAADKTAPACYASGDKVSVSRFRRGPAAGCDALVRPNWKLFNPALPRSAPQLLTIGHFYWCLGADKKFVHVGGCTANKRLLESVDRAALLAWLQ